MGDKKDRLGKPEKNRTDKRSGVKKGPHGVGSDPDK
ncbi:MAG: hypothetical protein QOJ27_2320 [Sphingomonadales bacterium]|jgi:hypothetical protein|nr:hypothetical protein [Sphingomonadales bacterium]